MDMRLSLSRSPVHGMYGHTPITVTSPYSRSMRTRSCPRRLHRVRRDVFLPPAVGCCSSPQRRCIPAATVERHLYGAYAAFAGKCRDGGSCIDASALTACTYIYRGWDIPSVAIPIGCLHLSCLYGRISYRPNIQRLLCSRSWL